MFILWMRLRSIVQYFFCDVLFLFTDLKHISWDIPILYIRGIGERVHAFFSDFPDNVYFASQIYIFHWSIHRFEIDMYGYELVAWFNFDFIYWYAFVYGIAPLPHCIPGRLFITLFHFDASTFWCDCTCSPLSRVIIVSLKGSGFHFAWCYFLIVSR